MATIKDISRELETKLAAMSVDVEAIRPMLDDPKAALFADLPIDSKDVLVLAMMLEEAFDIEIEVTDFSPEMSLHDFLEAIVRETEEA